MSGGGTRVLFAGGGTGGHVFPGVALAQRLLSDDPAAKLHWLCTSRPFDAAQLAPHGFPHRALESPRWTGVSSFLAPMARSLLASAAAIRELRPQVLVGVGGYGSVPPALAAKALGVPYVLLEQNARPGKANRFLAPGALRLYVQWAAARSAFPGCGARVRVTGSPLRAGLRRVPRAEALARFGLSEERPTVAVVGGSQGAEALNRGVVEGLDGTASRLQLIHVAGGAAQAEQVRAAYAAKGARATVLDFCPDMEKLYSAADLVVSRAGALAIAELAAFRVPAVLVPLARSAGDHQRENARELARAGAALMIEERDGLPGRLAPVLRRLVAGDPSFDVLRERLRAFARPDAADAVLADLREALGR
jgi:UDP-N-acetylglucosamine--N-acetylmuramyl-(pentapeptide) pyrophosphoryl-undecaprenol N-acetylglucosamine transferase